MHLDCLKEFRLKNRRLSDEVVQAEVQTAGSVIGAKINELGKAKNAKKKGHY